MLQLEGRNEMVILNIGGFQIKRSWCTRSFFHKGASDNRTGGTKATCLPIYGRLFVTVFPEDWAHRHISCFWFDSAIPWMVVLPCPPRSPDFFPGDFISFRTQVTSYRAVTSTLRWRLKLLQRLWSKRSHNMASSRSLYLQIDIIIRTNAPQVAFIQRYSRLFLELFEGIISAPVILL